MLPLIPLAIELVPMLARWLGGDSAGNVAQKITDVVTTVTGTSDPAVAAKMAAENPGMRTSITVQLAQIEAQMDAQAKAAEKDRLDNQFQTLQAVLSDVQSARSRDEDFIKSGRRNVRADLMLALVTGGLVVITAIVMFQPAIGAAALTFATTVGGGLLACVKDAFSFEFGSSRQSEVKTAMLANIAGAASPATANAQAASQSVPANWADITAKLKN